MEKFDYLELLVVEHANTTSKVFHTLTVSSTTVTLRWLSEDEHDYCTRVTKVELLQLKKNTIK